MPTIELTNNEFDILLDMHRDFRELTEWRMYYNRHCLRSKEGNPCECTCDICNGNVNVLEDNATFYLDKLKGDDAIPKQLILAKLEKIAKERKIKVT